MIDTTQIDRELLAPAFAPQLKLSKNEKTRLALRVQTDFRSAIDDHTTRVRRFTQMYKRWRGSTELLPSDWYLVPLTQWQVFAKWAKEHGALFGDDAEITATPIGPSDARNTKKASRFMTWLVFEHMKLITKASIFNFRKTLFGRAFALSTWERDTFRIPTIDGSEVEAVHYEGPGFENLWPDDIIVPAEDVNSIQEFSFVCRKFNATPDQLLEDDGITYQGIEEMFPELVNAAVQGRSRDADESQIQAAKDSIEGVIHDGSMSAKGTLQVIAWYGKWRMLKGRGDATEENLSRREKFERDLVVYYLPALHKVIGVQDLGAMYPLKKHRRPIVEASLVKDGSYWSAGFGELLDKAEIELTRNHALGDRAGKLSVGPVIFYTQASGFDPQTFEYTPGTSYCVDNPQAINVVDFKANMEYPVLKEQTVTKYAENVTGLNDMNLGRASDKPNAPRTARQTLALLSEGDIRASLDTASLREDWGRILDHFWDLCAMYAPKLMFFRVTEEDAAGLFQTQDGGAYLTEDERFGRYDFAIKFATSATDKQAKKQEAIELYQVRVTNPLVATNPRALWVCLDQVSKAFGDNLLRDVIPEPPDLGLPKRPSEEFAMMLQGEEVLVNPADNDDLHILDHQQRMREALAAEAPNAMAIAQLQEHILAHIVQRQQKRMMLAMVQGMAQGMAQQSAVSGVQQSAVMPGDPMTDPIVMGGGEQQPQQPAAKQTPMGPGGMPVPTGMAA
jgi:hypothetical protein